jgi:hypothetical protein
MNKKVIVIVGIIAVVGIGYYMYNKSKASSETGDLGTGATGTGDGSQTTKSTTGKPLETRKDKKQACGRKPLINKEKRALWEQCVASGGVASFDGDYGL